MTAAAWLPGDGHDCQSSVLVDTSGCNAGSAKMGVPSVLGQQFLAHPAAQTWQRDQEPSVFAALQQNARPVLAQQQDADNP
ncbi:hypothetical protein [Cupriavidus necator]|uniref:hypothetical protein n=1 Tax=Cupriavidus necator TaxID=106590 RepID=UPI0039C0E9A8